MPGGIGHSGTKLQQVLDIILWFGFIEYK